MCLYPAARLPKQNKENYYLDRFNMLNSQRRVVNSLWNHLENWSTIWPPLAQGIISAPACLQKQAFEQTIADAMAWSWILKRKSHRLASTKVIEGQLHQWRPRTGAISVWSTTVLWRQNHVLLPSQSLMNSQVFGDIVPPIRHSFINCIQKQDQRVTSHSLQHVATKHSCSQSKQTQYLWVYVGRVNFMSKELQIQR